MGLIGPKNRLAWPEIATNEGKIPRETIIVTSLVIVSLNKLINSISWFKHQKMKVSVVLGTRPEVIKLAPVIQAAKQRGHEVQVILTGQHRHMALPLLEFFGISPDKNLDVMTMNQSLTTLSERVLHTLNEMGEQAKSDVLLVQGDTTSAFVAGYWAFCHRIPVAHVEAGLRTYDLNAPFPEEANRQLIGRIARFHFAPTAQAKTALKKENVNAKNIFVVGNTAIDALNYTLKRTKDLNIPDVERLKPEILDFVGDNQLVLVTAHRRESFGGGFEGICKGIRAVADARKDVRIIYPVHPNPNVRDPVNKLLGDHPQIMLVDPLPYFGFILLMQKASVLLTDSGGIQEEGPTLRKPILVMRDTTERPEGVRKGFSKLVGTNPKKIEKETLLALKKGCSGKGPNPYGDGKSAFRIIKTLEKAL
jgi:UDP-N-acetylglucosamine 2-epimerase (non-hydrolysing)